jgi:hypothetical protein
MARMFIDKNGYKRFSDSGNLVDGWAERFRSNRPFMRRN